MVRDNEETHTQSGDVVSKILEMAGKKPGLPKSAIGWIAALAVLGYIRDQFSSMDNYIQTVASKSPAIVGFHAQVATNFNDLGKQLGIYEYRLQACESASKEIQGIKETLAVLRSKK